MSRTNVSSCLILDKIIIPENIVIRLINKTEVSAEQFYLDLIKQIQVLQKEAQKTHPKDQPKMNRSDFNRYLHLKSIQLQNDSPIEKKLSKNVNKDKKNDDQDDEDFDIESSGDKVTTIFPTSTPDTSDLNDTTIVFDQEQED